MDYRYPVSSLNLIVGWMVSGATLQEAGKSQSGKYMRMECLSDSLLVRTLSAMSAYLDIEPPTVSTYTDAIVPV